MKTSVTKRNWESIMKWVVALLIAVVVAKWVVPVFFPTSVSVEKENAAVILQTVAPVKSVQKVRLEIDIKPLKDRIGKEYVFARKDVEDYLHAQIKLQKRYSNERLTQEDGFLDWIFGWGTGYKMLYKKVKGLFGSDDNEVKLVSEKFKNNVMTAGLNEMISRVQNYAQNRMKDYQKSMVVMTKEFLNIELSALKTEGYTHLIVDEKTIPLNRYIFLSASDGFVLAEITGLTGVSVVAGKVVGAKAGALLGPKMLGLLSTKASAIVAGKIASYASLFFAPLVDYLLNEATKEWKYEDTRQMFSIIVSETLDETENSVKTQLNVSLDEVRNRFHSEVNKNLIVEGEK